MLVPIRLMLVLKFPFEGTPDVMVPLEQHQALLGKYTTQLQQNAQMMRVHAETLEANADLELRLVSLQRKLHEAESERDAFRLRLQSFQASVPLSEAPEQSRARAEPERSVSPKRAVSPFTPSQSEPHSPFKDLKQAPSKRYFFEDTVDSGAKRPRRASARPTNLSRKLSFPIPADLKLYNGEPNILSRRNWISLMKAHNSLYSFDWDHIDFVEAFLRKQDPLKEDWNFSLVKPGVYGIGEVDVDAFLDWMDEALSNLPPRRKKDEAASSTTTSSATTVASSAVVPEAVSEPSTGLEFQNPPPATLANGKANTAGYRKWLDVLRAGFGYQYHQRDHKKVKLFLESNKLPIVWMDTRSPYEVYGIAEKDQHAFIAFMQDIVTIPESQGAASPGPTPNPTIKLHTFPAAPKTQGSIPNFSSKPPATLANGTSNSQNHRAWTEILRSVKAYKYYAHNHKLVERFHVLLREPVEKVPVPGSVATLAVAERHVPAFVNFMVRWQSHPQRRYDEIEEIEDPVDAEDASTDTTQVVDAVDSELRLPWFELLKSVPEYEYKAQHNRHVARFLTANAVPPTRMKHRGHLCYAIPVALRDEFVKHMVENTTARAGSLIAEQAKSSKRAPTHVFTFTTPLPEKLPNGTPNTRGYRPWSHVMRSVPGYVYSATDHKRVARFLEECGLPVVWMNSRSSYKVYGIAEEDWQGLVQFMMHKSGSGTTNQEVGEASGTDENDKAGGQDVIEKADKGENGSNKEIEQERVANTALEEAIRQTETFTRFDSYQSLVETIMPTYPSLPSEFKQAIVEAVAEFLDQAVGPEFATATESGQLMIPDSLMSVFKSWLRGELRSLVAQQETRIYVTINPTILNTNPSNLQKPGVQYCEHE
ncbi:hypothetical protein BC830DRAFT_1222468 [Chytriomyces sp. MP71]|nr:hypothetical protein BC830DRAFT_1222468 [Chytriomyces sp. MP71]